MGLLRDLRDVLKAVKRRRPSKIYCPKCGSPQFHLSMKRDVFVTPKHYICDACGYCGLFVMELEKGEV
jgi:C4-type Zn-finger protein